MGEEKSGGPTLKSGQGCCGPSCTRCAGKRSAGCSRPWYVARKNWGNLRRNTPRKGCGRTIRPLLLKALLYAYAPGRRKIKVPEEVNRTGRVSGYGMGRWQMRRVSIRLDASADRTVSGAGQSYSGSGRRGCAAVVVVVVRSDGGRGRGR